MTGSWLCRDDLDRERLLDMEHHLRPVRVLTMAVIAASLLATAATILSAPAVVIFTVAILSLALMRSDVHHRGAAVIDPLTGMLNRKALTTRVEELAQQSRVSGQPTGLIMGDLDHFKGVNDSHGHASGDAVLKDIAYSLRKHLRAFDLAYRIGGEEFLIVLLGAHARRCAGVAEELRRRISEGSFGDGVRVTMSFGVSASAADTEFDYAEVFAAADAALYEAKEAGRDRVCVRPSPPSPSADGADEAPDRAPDLVTT